MNFLGSGFLVCGTALLMASLIKMDTAHLWWILGVIIGAAAQGSASTMCSGVDPAAM
jgi:hypothetical protein